MTSYIVTTPVISRAFGAGYVYFLPGSHLYVEAANGFLCDQLLFGSSYPFRAMSQTVEDILNLGFKEQVLDSVLSKNAERLLKLDL